jgi:hypothetical protein
MARQGNETRGLSLYLLLDSLTALRGELRAAPGLIGIWAAELERDLSLFLGYVGAST